MNTITHCGTRATASDLVPMLRWTFSTTAVVPHTVRDAMAWLARERRRAYRNYDGTWAPRRRHLRDLPTPGHDARLVVRPMLDQIEAAVRYACGGMPMGIWGRAGLAPQAKTALAVLAIRAGYSYPEIGRWAKTRGRATDLHSTFVTASQRPVTHAGLRKLLEDHP